jgi:hypothetical protein
VKKATNKSNAIYEYNESMLWEFNQISIFKENNWCKTIYYNFSQKYNFIENMKYEV